MTLDAGQISAAHHALAHERSARHIQGGGLIAQGIWHGRLGAPGTHAPMYAHLWCVGPDRFVCDTDWSERPGSGQHCQQESHRADTAREIYDLLPEHLAPFPRARKEAV